MQYPRNSLILHIGSTYLDEYNETRVAILHWRLAHHIRLKGATYIGKCHKKYYINEQQNNN